MKKAYECVELILDVLYRKAEWRNITYYFKGSDVVATKDKEDVINMYFNADTKVLRNDNGYALVTIAKDFRIVDNKNVRVQDVVIVKGMFGTTNRMVKVKNSLLESEFDHAVVDNLEFADINSFLMGSIGDVSRENGGIMLRFSSIPIAIAIMGQEWKGIDGFHYNLFECKQEHFDFVESDFIYPYLRKEHSWYWDAGFSTCNSDKTRSFIEETKYRNYHSTGAANIFLVEKNSSISQNIRKKVEGYCNEEMDKISFYAMRKLNRRAKRLKHNHLNIEENYLIQKSRRTKLISREDILN